MPALTIMDLPKDSILRCWCEYLSSTEAPFSYALAAGLSTIGVMCRRQRFVDQALWRVFPNMSILFVGPSGVGKDSIINPCIRSVERLQGTTRVPVLGGATMESLHERLRGLGKVAAAYIPAPEITAFFGKADYQANMLTGVTNLLSNGEKVDITTKSALAQSGGTPSIISQPTITMHAGSTVEWLHKGMPEGTLEGGFLGRFLIIVEEIGGRFVPLVKRDKDAAALEKIRTTLAAWYEGLELIAARCKVPREVILFPEAEDMYANWYYNRFRQFSRAVMPYANRSRDTVLRLAMLVAISRLHDRWVDEEDMALALRIIAEVAERIDAVVLPPSREAQVAGRVLELLPATTVDIYRALGTRFSIAKDIDPAIAALRQMGKAALRDGVIRRIDQQMEEE